MKLILNSLKNITLTLAFSHLNAKFQEAYGFPLRWRFLILLNSLSRTWKWKSFEEKLRKLRWIWVLTAAIITLAWVSWLITGWPFSNKNIPLPHEWLRTELEAKQPSNAGAWSFLTLLSSSILAFVLWKFRDTNQLWQIENQRKDINLKDFQKLSEWASGSHLLEDKVTKSIEKTQGSKSSSHKEEEIIETSRRSSTDSRLLELPSRAEGAASLQISAIVQLQAFLRGEYGQSFKKPTFALLTSIWQAHMQKHADEWIKVYEHDEFENHESELLENWLNDLKSASETPLAKAISQVLAAEKGRYLHDSKHLLPRLVLSGISSSWPGLSPLELDHFNLAGIEGQGAILKSAKLRYADLKEAKLQGADLSGSLLQGAQLREANLQGAYLNGAQLQSSDLSWTELERSNFISANLQFAKFVMAVLKHANFQNANLRYCDLEGAELDNATFAYANLENANLKDAVLNCANFEGARLKNANLEGADLYGVLFRGIDLEGAQIPEADLSKKQFISTNLKNANLIKSNLTNVNFYSANLIKANLKGCDLSNASLTNANLEQCNLHEAKLGQSIMIDSNLKKANIQGAKFFGANLCGSSLINCIFNSETKFYRARTNSLTKIEICNYSGKKLPILTHAYRLKLARDCRLTINMQLKNEYEAEWNAATSSQKEKSLIIAGTKSNYWSDPF